MHNENYLNVLKIQQSDQQVEDRMPIKKSEYNYLQLNSFQDLNIQINEQIGKKYVPINLIYQSINSIIVRCLAKNQYENTKLDIKCSGQLKQQEQVIMKISKSAKYQFQIYQKLNKLKNYSNFIKFHDVIDDCLIMECCEGSVKDIITNNQVISNQLIIKLLKDCLKAFKLLQQISVIHCDIKPQNILYRKCHKDSIQFVIIDFSNSLFEQNQTNLNTKCGQTWCYRAPELIGPQKQNNISRKIDLWGLGCILFQCLTGHNLLPLQTQNQQAYIQYYKIYATQEQILKRLNRFAIPSQFSLFQKILLSLLKQNKSQRLTIYQFQELLKNIDFPIS